MSTSRFYFLPLALCLCLLYNATDARPRRGSAKKSVAGARAAGSEAKSGAGLQETVNIYVDGHQRKTIHLLQLNSIRYCAFSSLGLTAAPTPQRAKAKSGKKTRTASALKIFDKSTTPTTSDNVLISGHRIATAPGSFFVRAESNDQQRVLQLTVPTILVAKTILVPYPQFFDALASIGLCEVNERKRSISWTENSTGPVGDTPRSGRTAAVNPLTPVEQLVEQTKSKDVELRRSSSKQVETSDSHSNSQSKTAKATKTTKTSKSAIDTDQPDESPVVAPDQESSVPMRYQLPGDLKRRELDDTAGLSINRLELKSSDGSVRSFQDMLASIAFLSSPHAVRVKTISTEVSGSHTTIRFHAEKAFPESPTVEFERGVIRLVFPACVNAVKDLAVIRKLNVAGVRSGLEEGAQVYTIALKSADRSVRLELSSDEEAVLHIGPKAAVPSETTPAAHSKWNLDCIVIDAGHGGKDGGAESINGHYEKDITLDIALKLRDEIRKRMPETKVVMTRSTDVFVELDKRGEIANKAGGKLFISIHCNSTPTRPTNASGFETYILSPAKTNTAVEVAKRENAVIRLEEKSDRYIGLNDDQLIVATLAQNSFVKLSSTFAALVQKNMKVCTSMCERSVNQAGFIVLIGASMPAVLIETGFVTNAKDEKTLTTTSGQQKIAKGVAAAVKEYAATYAKMLKN